MHVSFHNVNDAFYWMVSSMDRTIKNPQLIEKILTPVPKNLSPEARFAALNMKMMEISQSMPIPITTVPSRNGDCYLIPEPVTITYNNPRQRVLWNESRDCNPFFHLIESIWMLAGENRVAPLAYFNKRMREFSDDEKTLHGAYGHRWRYGQSNSAKNLSWIDQLQTAIDILRKDPNTRRVVIQMWEPEDLLLVKSNPSCRDVPCNTEIILLVRNGLLSPEPCPPRPLPVTLPKEPTKSRKRFENNDEQHQSASDHYKKSQFLDMTVINRSNDIVWGCLGANYVHMSFLQEYIACSTGLQVGLYHQFTNNLHAYAHNWSPDKWLSGYPKVDPYPFYAPNRPLFTNRVEVEHAVKADIPESRAAFDSDCKALFALWSDNKGFELFNDYKSVFSSRYFQNNIVPLIWAWNLHRLRRYDDAILACMGIEDKDWQATCTLWLSRRKEAFEQRNMQNAVTMGNVRETTDDTHSQL